MVTGREIAQLFPSQELGRRFFDIAMEVARDDAHVIQQRAIFEISHSDGSASLGLELINRAEKIKPTDRTVRHTKANILRACASKGRNPLVREEFRSAARASLSTLTLGDAKKSHGFHTLALVLLEEIRDDLTREKSSIEDRVLIEKLGELQKVIRTGLSIFPDEARLLAAEAEYQKLLRQAGRALQLMTRAFERNKRLDWIAVRLALEFRDAGKLPKAIETLQSCLQANPSSKEANYWLGRLYADSNDSKQQLLAIECLRRAFTRGDNNYVAQLWYAGSLFLAKRYDEATAIFEELRRLPVASDFKRHPIGTVRDEKAKYIVFDGVVAKKEEGFMFLSLNNVDRDVFVYRGSVVAGDWKGLRNGSPISAKLAFTYRGPCAVDVGVRAAGS